MFVDETSTPDPSKLTPAQRLALMYPGDEWTPEDVEYLVESGLI